MRALEARHRRGRSDLQCSSSGTLKGAISACPCAQKDLDFLLGSFQRGLAVARQLHAALEGLERLIERQVAALEALDQALKLGQSFLEVGIRLAPSVVSCKTL